MIFVLKYWFTYWSDSLLLLLTNIHLKYIYNNRNYLLCLLWILKTTTIVLNLKKSYKKGSLIFEYIYNTVCTEPLCWVLSTKVPITLYRISLHLLINRSKNQGSFWNIYPNLIQNSMPMKFRGPINEMLANKTLCILIWWKFNYPILI